MPDTPADRLAKDTTLLDSFRRDVKAWEDTAEQRKQDLHNAIVQIIATKCHEDWMQTSSEPSYKRREVMKLPELIITMLEERGLI